ncbi:MAG: monofunctional biosynthetic peptidoglycan transglycosylase [Prevotellaceae bacterium]|jgi:monofunctional biosynthetic peptidoglycan transglycosylase|nr:monofunctional biosynthetic peptidoglycan transglycosylase [Prevotellaceae bacterium]
MKEKLRKFFKWFLIIFFGSSVFFTVLYRFVNPPITPLMVIRFTEQVFSKDRDIRFKRDYVSIDEISPNLVRAAISSEDNRFLQHWGFDLNEIQKARKEAEKGKRNRGASTISQQCAKNVFLYPKHSWLRKGLEVYFTGLIEVFWSKKRIMEVYLNVIEYGDGIYGAEAAAQYYFHKSAAKLTKREASLIIACLPNPLKRNPAKPTKYINKRAAQIRRLMDLNGKTEF